MFCCSSGIWRDGGNAGLARGFGYCISIPIRGDEGNTSMGALCLQFKTSSLISPYF